MIIFIVPKNSGLKKYRDFLKSDFAKTVEVRGEDVPLFLDKLKGKKGIGITGEDLFNEFMRSNPESGLRIVNKVKWDGENCIFGRPCFCLLGPKGKSLEDFSGKVKICVNAKYKKIFEDYRREKLGKLDVEIVSAKGATEEFFEEGLADFVAEIVCSGKSMGEAGLKVYDKIFCSDVVIIENFSVKQESVDNKDDGFSLSELYETVKSRLADDFSKSYTKELVGNPNLLNRKIIEEAGEVVTAEDRDNLIWEVADILYFLIVKMCVNQVDFGDIEKELFRKNKEKLLKVNCLDVENE